MPDFFYTQPDYYKDAPHFRRIGDGPAYCLEIPRAKLDFTGTYSVIARNCHGEAKAIISLQIQAKEMSTTSAATAEGQYASAAIRGGSSVRHGNIETYPVFTQALKDVRCCDGDAVTLQCHVEALPAPSVQWEKDGHPITSQTTPDIQIRCVEDRATLHIRRVYPEDEGEYTCVARNNIGTAVSAACLIVDGKLYEHLSMTPGRIYERKSNTF